MINTHYLELPLSRTYFHIELPLSRTYGSKGVRAIEVLLYFLSDIRSHCDRELNATSGRLLPYNAFEHIAMSEWRWDCFNVVALEEGHLVHIDSFSLNLRQSTSCRIDFVQVSGPNNPFFQRKKNLLRIGILKGITITVLSEKVWSYNAVNCVRTMQMK